MITGQHLSSATPEASIFANIVNPQYIVDEQSLARLMDVAVHSDCFGAKAIAVEREFTVNLQASEKVTKLFEKRFEYNVMLVLEGDNLIAPQFPLFDYGR